jgi:hypothetical protein
LAIIEDGEFINEITNILQDENYQNQLKSYHPKVLDKSLDTINFYYYNVGFTKGESLEYFLVRLDTLVVNPDDSHLITFIPFFDDTDIALAYLDKLAKVSDGAMSELIYWAINYLTYKNKDDADVLEKIKQSFSFKLLILGNKKTK